MGVAPGILARLEAAAENGMDSDGVKIIRRYDASGGDLGAIADAESRAHDFGHNEGVKECAAPLQIEEIRPGKTGRLGLAARRAGESEQLLLMGYRRVGTKQDPLDPTEDSGISADS